MYNEYGGLVMAIDFGFEPTRKNSGFIFISYAHKDADIVAPYVAELNRQGVH